MDRKVMDEWSRVGEEHGNTLPTAYGNALLSCSSARAAAGIYIGISVYI